VKVGDLVKNIHGLVPYSLGIVIEISEPQLTNPNACPYRVQWINNKMKPAWMAERWLEVIND
tara:strand:+ start:182 stop:367 length:186 start_codon:yes stop_codon:yes gene_type:complete